MAKDLLWEIGLEEIPARFLPPVVKQMGSLAAEALANAGLEYEKLDVYATPRRLALAVTALSERSADSETLVKGPAKAAAFDEKGEPTRALLGFCKGQGLEPAQLIEQELNGNMYMYANKKTLGKPAIELLPQALLYTVEKLYFPKPMRWGYNTLRFARPVRWLVALFGTEIIDVSFGGVQADRYSRGHRLLGSDHIELAEPSVYLEELRKNYVIADQNERREMCRTQINEAAASVGGHVREDDELLEEVTYLVEYPTALTGCFEDKYLDIPEELVTTPMVDQQRYFPVYGSDDKLLPRFITVRNGDSRHLDIVAAGNEKVLRARLADAEFFYKEDLKDKMDDKVEELASVVFHEKLGTSREKVERFTNVANFIGRQLGYTEEELAQTARAAYLAKADLGSRVVYEFPELQGIIGEYYALAAGEDPVVAQAVREHYLPRFAGDELPQTKPGIAVALADKVDSLAGFFLVGIIPSGSQDPYALRRAAAGCAQIIMRHGLELLGSDILVYATNELMRKIRVEIPEQIERTVAVVNFLQARADNILSEEGVSYDILNAVRPTEGGRTANINAVVRRVRALEDFRKQADYADIMAAITRADNIVRSAAKGEDRFAKAIIPNLPKPQVDTALMSDPAENALYEAVLTLEKKGEAALAAEDIPAVLAELAAISPAVNAFFEAVMVMDKDEAVKANRLNLLSRILNISDKVADLSKLVD